jgi:membrane fusion protein (multidrug efflux system)
MATPFSRTLRALEADRGLGMPVLGAAVLLLCGWATWFVAGRLTLYETTGSARLEVDQAARALVAEVEGRVVAVSGTLGQEVAAGAPILEIDAEPLRIREEEILALRLSLTERLASAGAALAAEEAAQQGAREAAWSAAAQARALAEQAESALRLAEASAASAGRLLAAGSLSPGEAERLESEAAQARSATEAARAQARKSSAEAERNLGDHAVRLEALRRELAALEAQAAAADAALSDVAWNLERSRVTAPVAGRIVELAALRPGDRVTAGTHLGSVLPEGRIQAVAHFPPEAAVGRIAPGQQAALRLDAFPWTQYGTLPARVRTVAGEARDGQVRVELDVLAEPGTTRIPLQHGLVGQAEIAVERISPAALVLRTAGRALAGH